VIRVEALGFSRRDRARFLDVEFALNRDDPCWVPPLRFDRMRMFNPKTNAIFRHTDIAHYVAVRDGRDVGRIAAITNPRHREIHGEDVGFFGFLEVGDDAKVLETLIDVAANRARDGGATILRGPLSYDINGIVGALVGPFDVPPRILMPYNRPSLPDMLTAAGFRPAKDVVSWDKEGTAVPPRLDRIVRRIRRREGIRMRSVRMSRFAEEVEIVRRLYNSAWERNWGFLPLTDAEIDDLARDLKPVIDPELLAFAEVNDRPVGFTLALPDLNEALRAHRSGRLFPTGIFRLLFRRRWIRHVRVLALGVAPEFRNRGLEVLLYAELSKRMSRRGYSGAECGWILEDNAAMNRGIEAGGGRLAKRYRIYDRSV